jgi:hypothetical protein
MRRQAKAVITSYQEGGQGQEDGTPVTQDATADEEIGNTGSSSVDLTQQEEGGKCVVFSLAVRVFVSNSRQNNLRSCLKSRKVPTGTKKLRGRSGSTQEMSCVAESLKVGFMNIKGLKRKVDNKDVLGLLKSNDICGLAESWAGFETYNMKGYTSYIKERNKTARFGRNPGGLVVYVKNGLSKKVTEIQTEMKEVIWIGVKSETILCIKVCIS